MTSSMPASAVSRQCVFLGRIMAGVACVSSSIARLVAPKVVEALRPALRQRSNVTVMRIKAVVDMSEEAVWTVKPGAGAKKHPANKPVGSVITVRSTVVWGIVEVAVRAHGSHTDVYANRNLGWRRRYRT